MPDSLPASMGQGKIPVENEHYGAHPVPGSGSGGNLFGTTTFIHAGVRELSRGFYKLEISIEGGKKYWDYIWVYRP